MVSNQGGIISTEDKKLLRFQGAAPLPKDRQNTTLTPSDRLGGGGCLRAARLGQSTVWGLAWQGGKDLSL